MSLPADLLQAVSASGGGKITLIVGAGDLPLKCMIANYWAERTVLSD